MKRVLVLVMLAGCVQGRTDNDDPSWTSWDDVVTTPRVPVRVASWNVQELGEPGTTGYNAAAAIVRRLDADVVLLNEVVASEGAALAQLADDLGYATVDMPGDQPFGDLGNAVLSRLEVVSTVFPDGADLSGDASAHDLTRRPVVHTVVVPGTDKHLTVVGVHWKSGFEPDDLYRRAVDAYRTGQAAQLVDDSDFRLVLGDLNVQSADMPETPPVLDATPVEVGGDYVLGTDLQSIQDADGLTNDPYAIMAAAGLLPIELAQRDGTLATRPTSGRRIDRVLADEASRAAGLSGEVYDSHLEEPEFRGLADGDPKPDKGDVTRASDHLPLLVELRVAKDE